MHRLKWKGCHYQIGVERGSLLKRSRIIFPLRLDRFQLAHGKRSEAVLRAFFPEACAEIQGVSDALGADYAALAAWLLCMGCCLYNLLDNLPVEVRGCTAFAQAAGGRVIYGRNNDLPSFLKQASKSELYLPTGGNRFCMTTSSFLNGEEGLNEHGLAVGMTFVATRLEQIRPGLNACFAVRYLLEKAAGVKEALSLLQELPIASNCNLLLADQSGEMAVVECTPLVKRIRKPLLLGAGKAVCAVNRFLCEELQPFEAACGGDYRSAERYKTVMDCLSRPVRDEAVAAAMRLLKGDDGFMCQYDDIPDFETVWSSVFDLNNRMIYRADGDPRAAPFVADSRLAALLNES